MEGEAVVMRSTAVDGSRGSSDSTFLNVVFVLLGVAGLVLKAHYSGPQTELVHNYGGNVVATFAVYFILATPLGRLKLGWASCAVLALGVVELFEATDGFQVMSNTYDPADYVANGAGIVLALLVDAVASRVAGSGTVRNS